MGSCLLENINLKSKTNSYTKSLSKLTWIIWIIRYIFGVRRMLII